MIELDTTQQIIDETRLDRTKRRIDEAGKRKDLVRESLTKLIEAGRQTGRDEVYGEIRRVFSAVGPFKGRLYFDDAEDFIQEIQSRLKGNQ